MKNNKIIVISLIFMLISVSFIPFLTLSNADPDPVYLSFESVATERFDRLGPGAIDLHYEGLGAKEIAVRQQAAEFGPESLIDPVIQDQLVVPGDSITITVSDDGAGVDYDENFYIIDDGVGDHGILLVEEAAYLAYGAYGEYRFPNPETYNASSTDPWLREYDVITQTQLLYLLDEFDNNIWVTVTDVFGEPLARGAEGQKIWILIFNIRDDAYYNPDAESYIAGYFSASESTENQKNIMHIDSYDWERRTGPDAPRPFLYEGVFAHEFQHLVHFDQDPDEPSWVDEGCAELAMFLCGYGHPDRHIDEYFFYHPVTSLTFWGGGLEDYGQKYLWILYLYEKFGGADFISALVQEQLNGIEAIDKLLKGICPWLSFDMVYDWWAMAIYLDDENKFGGIYGFDSIEIGSADTYYGTIEAYLQLYEAAWGFPQIYEAPFEVESDWWWGSIFGDPKPYCPHYFRFTNEKLSKAYFDGDDWSGVIPSSGSYEWYSDADAWAWRSISQTFDLTSVSAATLTFMTYFEIEDDWDYGYVEVYNHGDGEWYTLEVPGITVNTVAHPQDNPNTPAGREPSDYEAAGRWNAFTGASWYFDADGWLPVSMDLTPFTGNIIDIYFTLWQDGAFTLQNMYIDDIEITEIGFFDDVEAGEGGWAYEGWFVTDGMFDNNFGVTLLMAKIKPPEIDVKLYYSLNMWMNHIAETSSMWLWKTHPKSHKVRVAIVSNHANHILPAHYVFGVEESSWKCWKW
ncbi:MAG: hypothetical protein ACFFFT_10145 [Candidatus Thorarchaeota archaeon]